MPAAAGARRSRELLRAGSLSALFVASLAAATHPVAGVASVALSCCAAADTSVLAAVAAQKSGVAIAASVLVSVVLVGAAVAFRLVVNVEDQVRH